MLDKLPYFHHKSETPVEASRALYEMTSLRSSLLVHPGNRMLRAISHLAHRLGSVSVRLNAQSELVVEWVCGEGVGWKGAGGHGFGNECCTTHKYNYGCLF